MFWRRKRGSDYVETLVGLHGRDEKEFNTRVQAEVDKALAICRWECILSPARQQLRGVKGLFQLLWRAAYGRYRRAGAEVHGGTNQTSGASPGWAGPSGAPTTGAYSTKTFEDAGVRAGEVIAYRCWMLADDGLLHSAVHTYAWVPGQAAKGAPKADNHAGVYAFKNKEDAQNSYSNARCTTVTGSVYLWGEIYEHERGYRASRAYIASIDDSPKYDAAALRKRYKVGKKFKLPKDESE